MPPKSKEPKSDQQKEPIPFDEALRRLVNAPPQYKKSGDKQKSGSTRRPKSKDQ